MSLGMARTQSMTIDATDRATLLELARHSIQSGLVQDRLEPVPSVASPQLLEMRATFVTLRAHDDLRGCCGSIEARFPLAEDVWRNAWASAFADPRFPSLTPSEYSALDVYISVLSPLERVQVDSEQALLAALRPNEDGLLLTMGASRATFLPAVWEDLRDPTQFVRQLKLKAGWRADFWSSQIEAWRYTTESFGEH